MVMVLAEGLIRLFCFAQDFVIVGFSDGSRIRIESIKIESLLRIQALESCVRDPLTH